METPPVTRRRALRLRCWPALAAFAALVAPTAGCGSAGPKVVPVAGTATRGGKPVADVELTFHPEKGRPSWANTEADGRFRLDYSRDRDGAVLGRHRVTVRGRQPRSAAEEFAGKIPHPAEVREIVARYGNVETTPLVIEITGPTDDLVVPLD